VHRHASPDLRAVAGRYGAILVTGRRERQHDAMTSQWPELIPDEDRSGTRTILLAVGSGVAGGLVGWTAFYIRLKLWGLVLGAATTLLLAIVVSRLDRAQRPTTVFTLTLACILLTWPLAWVAIVFVRYWITGDSVGS
jgi:hypothetical protein